MNNYMEYYKNNMSDIITNGVLIKFPLLGSTIANLKFIQDTEHTQTAKTDGKSVYYNPEFIENLSYDEKVFIFAHEIMHVAFNHIARCKGKNLKTWNDATDAVINQKLIYEGLPMVEGMIDIPEALDKSAEEMYEILLQNNQHDNSDNNQNNQHDMWEDAANNMSQEDNQEQDDNESNNLEKHFVQKNQELKDEMGQEIRNNLKQQSSKAQSTAKSINFGEVGEAKPVLNWKQALRKELESEEEQWSYRRSNEENYYQARIEAFDKDEQPITEVLLDTSGSVSSLLIINFLKQLKPLLKESKLYVGCFDTKFYGFTEIKKNQDIDNFKVVGRGGTNFNLALKSFTNDKTINKIIFTDGNDEVSVNDFNKHINVIWIVYGIFKFNPCCGKVIRIDPREVYKDIFQKNPNNTDYSM